MMENRGLIKKSAAVILGITMAFGALALPNNNAGNGSTTAYAETVEFGDCTFEYTLRKDKTIQIDNVTFTGDTIMVPPAIEVNGTEYDVTEISKSFLEGNDQIKKVIFPDSVINISSSVLRNSSVETIILSDALESLGSDFAAGCPNLKSVVYNGKGIGPGKMGSGIFYESNTSGITNEKGAICLGNWLIKYTADDVSSVKPADLGTGDIKIEHLGKFALTDLENLNNVDLEGIRSISDYCFYCSENLTSFKNADSIERVGLYSFIGTAWDENAKNSDLSRLGSVLIHYKTDSDTIDLTSGSLAGIKQVKQSALTDCKNAEKLICTSDTDIEQSSLYELSDDETASPKEEYKEYLPLVCKIRIKEVILDGEELTYSRIIEEPAAYEWVRAHYFALKDSVYMNELLTNKTKQLFEQLDIPYQGGCGGKTGYTATEEFYIRLKIHNYISIYDYDHSGKYPNVMAAFLLNGACYCQTYADLTHYFLECAGINAQTLFGNSHAWNNTRIGDEWFESDDGWGAQNNNHSYGWFGLSSNRIFQRDPNYHKCSDVDSQSFIFLQQDPYPEHMIGTRTIGDIDGDGDRDKDDADILWNYLKGETTSIYKKGADVNFDGEVDITDAVLLEQFVSSKAIDPNNVPTDGFAAEVKVAFVNGTDYDNIQYLMTDRNGYITLPDDVFEAPEGMKIRYDIGRVGQKVRITNPLTVVQVSFVDKNTPDYILGDVNDDRKIDIEDAVGVIQHINGITPLDEEQMLRANVSKDKNIDIDDAVMIISYVNGNSTF